MKNNSFNKNSNEIISERTNDMNNFNSDNNNFKNSGSERKNNMNNNYNTSRILADNYYISNNTRETHLNNNDLIVGPSGAGKTGGYVIPNILQLNTSMIVADTKNNLSKMLSPVLTANGFQTYTIDFVKPENSSAYNPLEYIRRNERTGKYREQDIISLSSVLVKEYSEDAFWTDSAKSVIACLIGFVLEAFPHEEQNLSTVTEVYNVMINQLKRNKNTVPFLDEWEVRHPGGFVARQYALFKSVLGVDRTWGCITQFVTNALAPFQYEEARVMFGKAVEFRMEDLGRQKTVVFLNVSDNDRAFDDLVNMFYTQALQALIAEADNNENSALKVPVRIILDDFATNAYIPNFDKTISVIRSREISVSIILQSLSQLNTLYSDPASKTIINNCDHILYLGGSDLETTYYIANRVSKNSETILNMPLDKVWLLERGKRGMFLDRIKPYSITPQTVRPKSAARSGKSPKTAAEKKPGKTLG